MGQHTMCILHLVFVLPAADVRDIGPLVDGEDLKPVVVPGDVSDPGQVGGYSADIRICMSGGTAMAWFVKTLYDKNIFP